MNKKTYTAPTLEQYTIGTRSMLCASVLDPDSTTPDVMPSTDPEEIIGGEFGAPDMPDLNPMNMLFK